MQIGEGDEQVKENKLTIAMKKFENFKMGISESISEMEARFMKLNLEAPLSASHEDSTPKNDLADTPMFDVEV